ncbi:MAG: GNAT family N-acetyltransferase [Chloroflexi bacterium]|nr:GNAT family N-acetyltransferase [Chloroflexota bacterium]
MITIHSTPGAFHDAIQVTLEKDEAANSLMLGIAARLAAATDSVPSPPFLSTAHDERGLLAAALMTPPHKLVVWGRPCECDTGAVILVPVLVDAGWKPPGVIGPCEVAIAIARAWSRISKQPFHRERRQRVYVLTHAPDLSFGRGRLRCATQADATLVAEWQTAFQREALGEDDLADAGEATRQAVQAIMARRVFLWEDAQPVSMAMTSRPTRHGISISAVYTPPGYRRRGYATACVGALSRQLLVSQWSYCSLFADVTNLTAVRAYTRIGYQPVADYCEYAFVKQIP